MPRTRRLVAAVAVAGLLGGLAACAGGGRQASGSDSGSAVYPVVGVQQARRVLDSVDTALAAGARANSTAGFGARISGPYLTLEQAQITASAREKKALPAPTPVQRLALLVPAATGWPRFFVEAGRPVGSTTPELRVLVSRDARTPYSLWGQLTVLPGQTVPTVAAADTGAPALTPEASGLLLSPRSTVQLFAQYLTKGPFSPGASAIRGNSFSDDVLRRIAAERKALNGAATVVSVHTADPNSIYALRTSDGGALVIGVILQHYVVTVAKGRTVELNSDPELAALAGTDKFTRTFNRTSVELVAFDVPPAGKGGRISVIAAAKGDVSAAAK